MKYIRYYDIILESIGSILYKKSKDGFVDNTNEEEYALYMIMFSLLEKQKDIDENLLCSIISNYPNLFDEFPYYLKDKVIKK